jgi:Cys-rich four helix bundle protein (predicted Tat secretion target)
MQRRDTIKILAGSAAGVLTAQSALAWAKDKGHHKHEKHHGHKAQHASGGKSDGKVSFGELNHAAAHCNHVAQMCAGHCIALINEGQKMMMDCLQATLAAQAMTSALSELAGLRSPLAKTQASACLEAMTKCMGACEPHIKHHAECKECYEACQSCKETCSAYVG